MDMTSVVRNLKRNRDLIKDSKFQKKLILLSKRMGSPTGRITVKNSEERFPTSECIPAIDSEGILPFPCRNPLQAVMLKNIQKNEPEGKTEFGFEYGKKAQHLNASLDPVSKTAKTVSANPKGQAGGGDASHGPKLGSINDIGFKESFRIEV